MAYEDYEDLLDGGLPRPRSRNEALLMRIARQGGGGGSGDLDPGDDGWATDEDIDELFGGGIDPGEDGWATDDDIDGLFGN